MKRFIMSLVSRVRTTLVLAYRVLANIDWYWGELGIGQYFFDCEIQYPYLLTQYKWSPPAANCCLSCNQTAVGSGRRPL